MFFLGLVHKREVDFAVDPFGWRKDRFEVVDYLPMNKPGIGRIYIANPKESFDWFVYIKPLTIDSWCAVALFVLFVPIIMVTILIDCKLCVIFSFAYYGSIKMMFSKNIEIIHFFH